MKTSLGQMNGNDWEGYCQKLLRIRYQDYQKVPARFGGDFGIEGFTFSGLVFQCYCPDDDPCGKDLYEKQRDKITKDIGKLIKNTAKISDMGVNLIKEWHFLTPDYTNHELIAHCRAKESMVKSKNLPAIHSDFKIILKIEEDYISERQIYLGTGGSRVQPSGEELLQNELEKFLTSNNSIVLNIKTKLGKLSLSSVQQATLIKELVSGYVVGQNEMDNLNQKFPSIYKSAIQLKSAAESQLAIRSLNCSNNNGTILKDILDEYEVKLSSAFASNLSSALIILLSTEAISDWLGRCPLDFPPPGAHNENH